VESESTGHACHMTQVRGRRLSPAVACSLSARDLSHRHDRWHRLGERAGAATLITADGLQLVFHAAPGIEAELEQLAALERDCCSFATWSIQKRGNQLVLAVSAANGEGIAAVQAMFKTFATSIAAAGKPTGGHSVVRRGPSPPPRTEPWP
jgi:hypothetical protein